MKKLLTSFILLCALLVQPKIEAQVSQPTQSIIVEGIVASGVTQIIAGPSQPVKFVRIRSVYVAVNQTTTAANYGLVAGTGTNCANNQTKLTPTYTGHVSGTDYYSPSFSGVATLDVPLGYSVCLKLSAAPTSASVQILYTLENPGL